MALIPTYKANAATQKKPRASQANTPVNQHSAAPPAPRVPQSSYSQTPAVVPITPDPKDSQYYNQIAKLDWQRNNTVKDVTTSQNYDDIDLATALERRAQRLPGDRQNAKNTANSAGGFYSGALGKQLGQIDSQYQNDVQDLNTGYTRRAEARTNELNAADQGLGIDTLTAGDEAVNRQVARDIANPPVPVTKGVVSAGGGGSVNLYDELHRLSLMAKQSKGDANTLKNIAAYWHAYAGELKKNQWDVPAAPSALSKYV